MRIVFHLGAHCTDEDRLVRCLLKNRALLAEQGIVVPSPTRYRKLLRDTALQLKGAAASDQTQAMILDQIMDAEGAGRLVLSWDSFMSFPAWAVRGRLYDSAGERIRAFTRIFPDFQPEFHLAIRNPATYLPALKARVAERGQDPALVEADPLALAWSDAIRQILSCNPGVPLTVWCDEDTPLIWPEVLQAVSGHRPGTVLQDNEDVLALTLTEPGLAELRAHCAEHPPESVAERRRIVSDFLDRFARPEAIETVVDMPGWTQGTVDALTARYHADVNHIRRMGRVTFLEP
ncbi:hypothetical protein [Tabrizicola sp.]|uniref:hypothetical protein n=1 Tax=Tabrizicola sp. TaxID=2005166 RepID=UPI0035B02293